MDPAAPDAMSPNSWNPYQGLNNNPLLIIDPDGRQSIELNQTNCNASGCKTMQVSSSMLPFLSPSKMATMQQADALAESQARSLLFAGGGTTEAFVMYPMIATGGARVNSSPLDYRFSRQYDAMQQLADNANNLGVQPSVVMYGRVTLEGSRFVMESTPPAMVINGAHEMRNAETGFEFGMGLLDTTLGIVELGAMTRVVAKSLHAEAAFERNVRSVNESRRATLGKNIRAGLDGEMVIPGPNAPTPSVVVESVQQLPGCALGKCNQITMYSQTALLSTYKERLVQTPTAGWWSGQRGESTFFSRSPEVQLFTRDRGVPYRNAVPVFDDFAVAEVRIDTMSASRTKNFDAADSALSAQMGIPVSEIRKWRIANKYAWHEVEDMSRMQMIPSVVNAKNGHVGGVGEINKLNIEKLKNE